MKLKLTPNHALAGVFLLAAGGVAYLATRGAGPVRIGQFTELRQGPLQEHLITAEELGQVPERLPHRYPCKVAPGLSMAMTSGFSPLYRLPDPAAAALPAESD